MKPLRGVLWLGALGYLMLHAAAVEAAWDNVFQVTCHPFRRSSVSNYADPCCNPCPQQCCTTQYVQRCYYQPVTVYQTRSYYEPVTTYRTSFYWEPVTSYRYTSYYDPCTCCYRQVACPTTCYQLRSQCCPVQSWVQRCCQVPVTAYRQGSYWEPVTSCCDPCAVPSCPTGETPRAVAPPGVTEQRTAPTDKGTGSGSPLYDRSYSNPPQPSGSKSSLRPNVPTLPVSPPPPVPVQPPNVKLEKIVAIPNPTQDRWTAPDQANKTEVHLKLASAGK